MSTPRPRTDNYINTITGLGGNPDKSRFSTFVAKPRMDWETLGDTYEQDAIAARIIDRLPDDATREEITLRGEDTEVDFASVQSELEDLDARNRVGDAWRWARLYRGSLLVMNVNDGRKMDKPLNLEAATNLSSLHVVTAEHIQPKDFNPGLGSAAFSEPESYEITVPFGAGGTREIHKSRVIRFDGVKVPPSRMIDNNGWGPSVLERVQTEITQLGVVIGYARSIIHDISMPAFKLKGLRAMLCGDSKDQAEIRKAIEQLRMSMDNLHLVAIDSEDEYQELNRTVTGLNELMDRFVDALVRATDMPRTILLGEQPGGLNASGDSEIRAWYDFVAAQQKQKLTPALNRLLEVLFAVRKRNKETVPEEWTIQYAPLWQPSESEAAATEKTKSETAGTYVDMGAIDVGEVRTGLISSGYLPEDAGTEPPDDGSEEEIEALKGQMATMEAEKAAALAPPPPGEPSEPGDEPEDEPVDPQDKPPPTTPAPPSAPSDDDSEAGDEDEDENGES